MVVVFTTTASAIALANLTRTTIEAGYTAFKDTKSRGQDSEKLKLKYDQLTYRYDSLQKILFEENRYDFTPGRNLFDTIETRSQALIFGILQQLGRVLYSWFMLRQKYFTVSSSSEAMENSASRDLLQLPHSKLEVLFADEDDHSELQLRSQSSPILSYSGWKWSLRGKTKTGLVVVEFEDWLNRIRALLEDALWVLPALNKPPNLKLLEADVHANAFGISHQAGMRRLVIEDEGLPTDLKLAGSQLKNLRPLKGANKEVAVLGKRYVMVESLYYSPDDDGDLPTLLGNRFSQIARLLHLQKDNDLRVLRCLHYTNEISRETGRLRLIFELDTVGLPRVTTLLNCFSEVKVSQRPSLGVRFKLCYVLSQSIALFHSVGWIHRALRSENVLFILNANDEETDIANFSEPFITGFEACRLENDRSTGPSDDMISRNVYRPPDRWGTPKKKFSRHHDLYSLGIILLEVGLWEKAETMGGNNFAALSNEPLLVRDKLFSQAHGRLGHRCGDVFLSVVERCLSGDVVDGIADHDTSGMGFMERFSDSVTRPLQELASTV